MKSKTITPIKPRKDKDTLIESMLRVDHAGEFGATRIYQGQLDALGDDNESKETVEHMLQQEKEHFSYFDNKIKNNESSPSLLMPFWNISGYALGYITAKMGSKSAMACTVAIEETIDLHYQEQIKELAQYPEESELKKNIEKFREEELEHRDIGIEYHAEETLGYGIMYSAIKIGCKIAIGLAKKI